MIAIQERGFEVTIAMESTINHKIMIISTENIPEDRELSVGLPASIIVSIILVGTSINQSAILNGKGSFLSGVLSIGVPLDRYWFYYYLCFDKQYYDHR